jgi:hypothetical protein
MSSSYESNVDRVANEMAVFYGISGTMALGMAREVIALQVAYDARSQLDLESSDEITSWLKRVDGGVVSDAFL